ncbi:Pro-Pol polyprotein [Nosema granulosis]|uniref:Pro-Pol polyprotein n=1 Tax=Nosema granulosis TaxID=83296 RepID=A0A9P6GYL6_9MICR|nr:Pro-Pol polyprotein [Nosema granulosis]
MVIFYHDLLGLGTADTLRYALLEEYTWERCNKDIEDFVNSCEVCQKENPSKEDKDNIEITTRRLGDLWEADIVGPFRESEQGFKHILTMIDHYTKITEVAPLYTKDMASVLSLIDNIICKKYGIPKAILTDNGKEFCRVLTTTQDRFHQINICFKYFTDYLICYILKYIRKNIYIKYEFFQTHKICLHYFY